MDFGAFLRYWALTFAVFAFYFFALIVASLDTLASASEAARKRRAERKVSPLDPNPLAGRSVAETIYPGPGQVVEGKREWVARVAEDLVRRLNPTPPVTVLVLEDSKGHPLVHFSNGKRLESYRLDRDIVAAAMAGDAAKLTEVAGVLQRHLTADFLGREEARPPRTTELAREAAAKTPAARPAPAAPQLEPAAAPPPAGAPPAAGPAEAPTPADQVPAAPPAAQPADTEAMSREERLAAARAKAEALRQARQKPQP
jgi:hypothetical protein